MADAHLPWVLLAVSMEQDQDQDQDMDQDHHQQQEAPLRNVLSPLKCWMKCANTPKTAVTQRRSSITPKPWSKQP